MFNYIDVNVFRENMTKYPNGLSIFEALSTVITSFNSYVAEINSKVAEGILETDAARTALSAELNDLFGVLREEYQGDFQGLQAEVDAAVDTINDKVSQEQLAVFAAQLGETGQRIDNIVTTPVPTGEIIAQEIIDARQGALSVGANIAGVKSQLVETTEKLKGKNFKERKPYYTLHDDDGKANFMTKIKPVLDARGLKCSVAINPGYIGQGDFMTWANIEQLHSEGYEILNHGWIGEPLENLTLEQMQANYELEKAAFLAHGIDTYDYFVYSGSMPWSNADLKNKIQKVYKCCFAIDGATNNNIPFDTYAANRTSLVLDSVRKARIDLCAENSGYLVGFQHSWYEPYTVAVLESALDYITSKGFSYITTREAIDNFGNSIELGNNGGDYFYADKNGNVDFSYKGESVIELYKAKSDVKYTDFIISKVITDYKKNVVTFESIPYSVALTLGLPDAGLVETFRMQNSSIANGLETFNYQRYTKWNNQETWVRHWDTVKNAWALFNPIGNIVRTTAARPQPAYVGATIYDSTLGKPIWCKKQGYIETKAKARNTPYNAGDIIVHSSEYMFRCIQSGTTGATEPVWSSSPVTDGTVIWESYGFRQIWVDSAGVVV